MDNTKDQMFDMVDNGMELLSLSVFQERIRTLGYKVDNDNTFNYLNCLNERTYRAKSVNIVETSSGLSFANIDARRDDNFTELQDMRRSMFVFHRNRIWEL